MKVHPSNSLPSESTIENNGIIPSTHYEGINIKLLKMLRLISSNEDHYISQCSKLCSQLSFLQQKHQIKIKS
ncbi:hypothetical protein PIROE2DRAFT_18028, partial [Piromyces sp. E2]